MGKGIATEASTETGRKKPVADVNKTGSWVCIANTAITSSQLTLERGNALLSAEAIFSYLGGTTPGGPVPPISSKVTLSATPSKCQILGDHLLLEGDENTDEHGNRLYVSNWSTKALI